MTDQNDAGNVTNAEPGQARLRRQAEEKINAGMGETTKGLSPEETGRLLHELRVHQIELEIQNEELRRAQQTLAESQARYFNLYNLAPVGYVTVTRKGLIQDANLTAATMLGTVRSALVNQPLSNFISFADQDDYFRHRRRLFETGTPQLFELRLVRITLPGDSFWARLEATLDPNSLNGGPVGRIAISDISASKEAEDQLKTALKQKEVLLQELYHRTKNNMMVISSLISLQVVNSSHETGSVLRELQNRVMAMALVHEKLYQAQDLSHINLHDFIRELVTTLVENYQVPPQVITPILAIENITVLLDVAIPCALILNELISNSLKHAFPDRRPGEIRIELRQVEGERIELCFADNGMGVPADFDFRTRPTSGLRIVYGLVELQLGGTIQFKSEQGLKCAIRFNNNRYSARI